LITNGRKRKEKKQASAHQTYTATAATGSGSSLLAIIKQTNKNLINNTNFTRPRDVVCGLRIAASGRYQDAETSSFSPGSNQQEGIPWFN